MQKAFNYRGAHDFFTSRLETTGLSGRSFVFLGKEGTGKTHLLDVIEIKAKEKGYQVFRSRSFASNESLVYQAYNEILNQYKKEYRERQLSEIVESFSSMDPASSGNIIFMIDGLESMTQASRELFIYLSRTASRVGFSIFGTITEDYAQDSHSIVRFINLATTESSLQLIGFERANLEDIIFLLKGSGYNLPTSFLQEVFRLTNGNIKALTYTIRYYQDQGIINDKLELEEVTYRYFPIPPSFEVRFEHIIKELTEKERAVLEVIALIQEDISPSLIAKLVQLDQVAVVEILELLKSYGLVLENNLNYNILNSRLSEIVMGQVYSSSGYILSDNFVSQPMFKSLPFITRLRVYELRRDVSSIEELVNKEWRNFIGKLSYIGFSQDLFERLHKIVVNKEARAHISLLWAQSLQNIGDYDGAMKIYSLPDVMEVEEVYARLSMANLHQKADRIKESIGDCKYIIEMTELQPYDRVSTLNLMATNYSSLGMVELGEKTAEEAMERSIENDFPDLLAEAYGLLGTLRVKHFDLTGALENYKKALELTQQMKLYDRELLILNNIAIINSYKGDFEQAARMLTEIIEKSYIAGELLSRAYASYNLCEIYYNIGKKDEFRSYFPSAVGLVRMVGESNLSYPFFRFASLVAVDMMNFESSIKYSEELLKITKPLGIESREKIARGFYLMAQESLSLDLLTELEEIFASEIEEIDDFLPIWYLISGAFFCLKGDLEKAETSFTRQKDVAKTLGDSLGATTAKLGQAFQYLATGNKDALQKMLEDGFKVGMESTVFPDLTVKLLDYCQGKPIEILEYGSRDTVVNIAAMVLMGGTLKGLERGDLSNFDYFVKCRSFIGRKVEPI